MLTYTQIAALEGTCPATVRTYASRAYPAARRLKVIKKNARNHQIREVDYQRFLEANSTGKELAA